jgi:hypothetical protein
MHEQMAEIEEREIIRRIIGASMLGLGFLAILWGDYSNNFTALKFGKTTAVVGIVLYFLGRIGKMLRKS